jgi:hypothetical protein
MSGYGIVAALCANPQLGRQNLLIPLELCYGNICLVKRERMRRESKEISSCTHLHAGANNYPCPLEEGRHAYAKKSKHPYCSEVGF